MNQVTEQANGVDTITVADARKALAAERDERGKEFMTKLGQLMEEYRCGIATQQMWTNGVPGELKIVPIVRD